MTVPSWLKAALASIVAAVALVATPAAVSASSEIPPPPAADAGTTADVTWFSLDASVVLWIGAVLIPIIGGLAIKVGASEKVMALVNLVLTSVWSFIVTATTESGDAVFSKPLVMNFLQAFIISVGTLYGFYRPIGADAKLKSMGGVIGPSPTPPAQP